MSREALHAAACAFGQSPDGSKVLPTWVDIGAGALFRADGDRFPRLAGFWAVSVSGDWRLIIAAIDPVFADGCQNLIP
jgi:hypothetical protein